MSRARARSSASASRSRPSRRPSGAVARSTASAWPPVPRVPSTHSPPGLTASSSSVSSSRTGTWPASDSILREQPPVLVGERLLLEQPLLQALEVPDREVVLQPEDAHLTRHRRALAQQLRDQDPALAVERRRLAKEVHAIEEAQLRGVCRGHGRQTALDLEPDRHRVEPHEFAGHAGDEQLLAPLRLDHGAEAVRDFQPSLVVDACRMVASQQLRHSPRTESPPCGP